MRRFAILAVLVGLSIQAEARAEGWQAGFGRVAITPKSPIWMAGYGARKAPSDGAVHDIWAKSLALKDEAGKTSLLVTLDVCGIDRELSLAIRDAIMKKHGLPIGAIALACSHTHCGPVLGTNLLTMYQITDAQAERIKEYTLEFRDLVIKSADEALSKFEPVDVAWGRGMADFAVNRRENTEAKVADLRSKLLLKGPVDHDLPVLRVRSKSGADKAIVCGYACHCTVLDINKINGDYAGWAQIELEKSHPGAQAMFVAGCGADQNPQPRRGIPLAEKHGKTLAASVERVLAGRLQEIPSKFASAYEEIPLGFAHVPTNEEIEAQTKDKSFYIANRARMFQRTVKEKGKLDATYPYPVQVWNLGGGEIQWVFLGGEVVVDYSLRLKRNLDPAHTWVSGYTNDVMAYIPSLRVLKEGGYEGATAMIYYGRPSPWTEAVEEDIFAALVRVLKAAK